MRSRCPLKHRAPHDQVLGLHLHIASWSTGHPLGNNHRPILPRPHRTDAPGQGPFLSSLSLQSRQAGAISLSQSRGAVKRVILGGTDQRRPETWFSDSKRWVFFAERGALVWEGRRPPREWGPPWGSAGAAAPGRLASSFPRAPKLIAGRT